MATDINSISSLISSFRQTTAKDSITPESVGYIMQRIVNAIDGAEIADSDLQDIYAMLNAELSALQSKIDSNAQETENNISELNDLRDAVDSLTERVVNMSGVTTDDNDKLPTGSIPTEALNVVPFYGFVQVPRSKVVMGGPATTQGKVYFNTSSKTFVFVVGDFDSKCYSDWAGMDAYGQPDGYGRYPLNCKIYLLIEPLGDGTNRITPHVWNGKEITSEPFTSSIYINAGDADGEGAGITLGYTKGTAYPGDEGYSLERRLAGVEGRLGVIARETEYDATNKRYLLDDEVYSFQNNAFVKVTGFTETPKNHMTISISKQLNIANYAIVEKVIKLEDELKRCVYKIGNVLYKWVGDPETGRLREMGYDGYKDYELQVLIGSVATNQCAAFNMSNLLGDYNLNIGYCAAWLNDKIDIPEDEITDAIDFQWRKLRPLLSQGAIITFHEEEVGWQMWQFTGIPGSTARIGNPLFWRRIDNEVDLSAVARAEAERQAKFEEMVAWYESVKGGNE